MRGSIEWKNSKQIILENKSIEIDCDYQNTGGFVFTVPKIDKATSLNVTIYCYNDLIGFKEFVLTDIF